MNSSAKMCTKLLYVESTCGMLLNDFHETEAAPTLLWMQEECQRIVQHLISESGRNRQTLSWSRTVGRAMAHAKTTLIQEDTDKEREVTVAEGLLYAVSIITQMIEDLTEIKNKGHLFNDLCTASYTLENLLGLPKVYIKREDELREGAQVFINRFYSKLDEL